MKEMPTDDRLDPLLARSARQQRSLPSGERCLDAGTIAAWVDGTLSRTERTVAEAHASECDRCLAVVAAMGRTSPPARRPGMSWSGLKLLVPATTAAVAITTWVLMRDVPSERSIPVPAAVEQPAAVAPETAAGQQSAATRPAEGPLQKPKQQVRREAQAPDTAMPKAEAAAPRPGAPAGRSDPADLTAAAPQTAAPRPAAVPPPPATAAADAIGPTQRGASSLSAVVPVIVRSPDPDILWRLAGSAVQRSLDGGRTWTAQQTGTSAELLAGACPSAAVCWVTGGGGTILLTTDGQAWQRVDAPDPTADYIAVRANDARSATVTTAAGRTYRTADAGRTWTLQEDPATSF